ncbi:hypothetical protein [Paratractidigestivibacter sp.]|uniref:hypothetical protein n=1 Tax=Paratractidigestivibacter sp. TaxID=2847316 RepID=UPI002AC91070|nr:hypothetical protein [Paratractidigestivibacter sp.]
MQVLDSLIDGPLRLRNRREGDELIGMIVRYLRTGEEPQPRTDTQEAVLTAIRPVMETSRSRIVAGGNGGSKSTSKTASKTASEPESNDASKRPSEEEEEVGRGVKEEERGSKARFRAPSPAEVDEYARSYAASKGIDLDSTDFDPERFVDFYAQKDWMVGRSRMKDWKASVRNWVRTSKPREGKREVNDGGDDFSQYD